jgi:transcriptional regulator with GAF, ATPase, and Fis domain
MRALSAPRTLREASISSIGEGARASEPSVAAELRRAGVRVLPLQPDRPQPDGPAIVVFDAVSTEVCNLVRELSAGGRHNVVAVATTSRAVSERAAWDILRHGASELFAWDHSATPGNEIAARLERWAAVEEIVESPRVRDTLVGQSPIWRRLLREVVEIARFTPDTAVLVTGESGTGKELIARLVHDLDPRPRKGNLVVLDCATVVPSLSGSEFFGHERGAFTGAIASREGVFELADGGTLFLDEVGELPLSLQAELLRVIQEGTFKRVGGNRWYETRFRLVCATNRDLLAEGDGERFRRDFYYRIAGWSCCVPSLRDRRDDIPLLVRHFLSQLRDGTAPELDPQVERLLCSRDYEGNVRDLRHLVTRISFRHVGPGPITMGDVPDGERPEPGQGSSGSLEEDAAAYVRRALAAGLGLRELTTAVSDAAVAAAVTEEGGSLQRAAERLGVTPRALQLRRASVRKRDGVPTASDR